MKIVIDVRAFVFVPAASSTSIARVRVTRRRARGRSSARSLSRVYFHYVMASCVARAALSTPSRVVFYDKKRTPAAATRARVVVPRAADADADAAAPADAWLEARRADLSALTVEKGLKPLCRVYGLKLCGSKTALLERVLAHESANRAEFAPMEAVVEKRARGEIPGWFEWTRRARGRSRRRMRSKRNDGKKPEAGDGTKMTITATTWTKT